MVTPLSGQLIAMFKAILTFRKVAGLASPAAFLPLHRCAPLLVEEQKNTGVGKIPCEVFGHAGFLVNWSPGTAGLPFN
jgi:hypothetical protein